MVWLLAAVGALAGLILALVLIGLLLPKEHTATRTAEFPRAADVVWRVIADVQAYPTWRQDLQRVDVLTEGSQPVWKEVPRRGGTALTLQLVESDPPRRRVTKIADPKLPFGGHWDFELRPTPGGCTLTITENGEIYNPLFRVLSRSFNLAATIEAFLAQLGEHLQRSR
jgi:hypothetical protein